MHPYMLLSETPAPHQSVGPFDRVKLELPQAKMRETPVVMWILAKRPP